MADLFNMLLEAIKRESKRMDVLSKMSDNLGEFKQKEIELQAARLRVLMNLLSDYNTENNMKKGEKDD